MGSACGMHGREGKYTENYDGEPGRTDFLKDLIEAGRIILKGILMKQDEVVRSGLM